MTERWFENKYGRIRDIVQGPDGFLYFLTNNRDGRGKPRQGMTEFIESCLLMVDDEFMVISFFLFSAHLRNLITGLGW